MPSRPGSPLIWATLTPGRVSSMGSAAAQPTSPRRYSASRNGRPPNSCRSTRMSLVDDHPAVQAVDHALAELQERRAAFDDRAAALAEADAKAQAEYEQ